MTTSKHGLRGLNRATCLVAMVFAALLAPYASAQFGEAAGIAQSMKPEYFNRDITTIVRELELDETQRLIVEALFQDYNDEFDAGLARMKERFQSMRDKMVPSDPQRVLGQVFGPWEDWARERKLLGEQFLEDIRVILGRDQLERWPAFERSLFREKVLPQGSFNGESTNLFHILRDMHLPEPVALLIQPTVNEYDLALDAALRHREDVLRRSVQPMLKSLQESDAELSLKVIDEQIDARVAVRNVNDQFTEAITDALPGDLREDFSDKALTSSYPRAYRSLPILRLFQAAMELEALPAETIEQIEELDRTFRDEVAPLNAIIMQEIRVHDPASFRWRAEVSAARMAGEAIPKQSNLRRPDFNEREDLCRRYAMLLRGLLTEEQYDSLPGSDRWMRRIRTPEPKRGRPEDPQEINSGPGRKPMDPRDRDPRDKGGKNRGGAGGRSSMGGS